MKKVFASFAVSLGLLMGFIPQVQADATVKNAMVSLKDELNKLGEPSLKGSDLYFGSNKINGDYTVVDAIKQKHSGTATVFVKDGSNFIRISTNVMKAGQRAVGTPLDPSGPAKAAIDAGNAFYGPVDILGKIYQTGYEPIVDAQGNTVGI
ncbi:MAG: cache domain-containing protein, partial [Limnobacter sp.]|nr:cache domain-containing protein [Limnobacter sp.]